ncbi:MAG TPA: glycosyltransferase [Verrucomicrobiae bacterium]|jgi:glycosyltransferase involved in cell wall biosynthesis
MASQEKKNSIAYSLADQNFARAKSVGIFNVSMDLLHTLATNPQCPPLTVLANSSLRDNLKLPQSARTIFQDTAIRGRLGRMWWDQVAVYSAARRAGSDWLLLPKGFASFARRCPVRLAPLVHDVLQDHYDRHYPTEVSKAETLYFRASLKASLEQAEVIFTPTEFTSREIQRMARGRGWPVPPLVYCGEGFERPAAKPRTERRDIVVLASRFPYKLTRQAVDFFSRWVREYPFKETVHWIGSLPPKFEMPALPQFRWHPRLAEKEFRELMGAARVVAFTSEYEGFGRPPVEAVLAGACPVFSDIPATREVMNGAGCPFTNGNYESFAAAIRSSLSVTPAQLEAWSQELMRRHNWSLVVDRVLEALRLNRDEHSKSAQPALTD